MQVESLGATPRHHTKEASPKKNIMLCKLECRGVVLGEQLRCSIRRKTSLHPICRQVRVAQKGTS